MNDATTPPAPAAASAAPVPAEPTAALDLAAPATPAEPPGSAPPVWAGPARRVPPGWLVRATVLPTALVGAAVTAGWALVAGWPGATGAGLGTGVVVAFFGLDLLALRSASRRFPDAPVHLALLGYLAKLIGLGALLWLVRGSTAVDSAAFAVAALAGTVVWLSGQIRVVGRLVRLPAPVATPEPAQADLATHRADPADAAIGPADPAVAP